MEEDVKAKMIGCIKAGYLYHFGETYWGKFLQIVEKESAAGIIRVSWYEDEFLDTAYIENLSVSFSFRELGYGRELLSMAEDICRALGRKYAELGVEKGSWQEGWYRRRGYIDCEEVHEELTILKKEL